jgi:uncharacterized protein (DUF433 family)
MRVPVAALFENLRDGVTIMDILDWFLGCRLAHVEAVVVHSAALFTRVEQK